VPANGRWPGPDEPVTLDRVAALAAAESACNRATDRLPGVTPVTSIHHFSLRGLEVARKACVEVLARGSVIGASKWVVAPPGANIVVDLTLTAAPGTYAARQATNVGSNVHEDIVRIDLGTFVHPAEDAVGPEPDSS